MRGCRKSQNLLFAARGRTLALCPPSVPDACGPRACPPPAAPTPPDLPPSPPSGLPRPSQALSPFEVVVELRRARLPGGTAMWP